MARRKIIWSLRAKNDRTEILEFWLCIINLLLSAENLTFYFFRQYFVKVWNFDKVGNTKSHFPTNLKTKKLMT